jgi:outer membrane protein assembly factor BamA
VTTQVDGNDPSLGADIEFVRFRFSASAYVPLTRRINVALRTSQGLLWPGEGFDRIPLQERFYNGGQSTVRSFRESRLGPLDPSGKPTGGSWRNVFTAELRVPLGGLLESSVFADAGNVGEDIEEFGLAGLRWGLGLGIRLRLPIGPVRVDGAWNPDREIGEDEWVIHLSVGYPF